MPDLPPEDPHRGAPFRPYARALKIVAAHFLLFTLARLALYLVHHRDFSSLSAGTVLLAFLRGLRFDASMICMVIAAPVFLLLLPFRWAQSRWWQGIWSWVSFAALVLFAFVLTADIIYFGFIHRHVGPEIACVDDSIEQVWALVTRDYLWAVLGFIATSAALGFGWRRWLRGEPVPPTRRIERGAVAAIVLTTMIFAAQGTIAGKRLKVIHAFVRMPPAGAYLTLNGPFAIFHSFDDDFHSLRVDFFPWPEAVRETRELLYSKNDREVDPEFPLLRSRPERTGPPLNVVLIMGESWDGFYFDSIRREMGLPPLGLTPNFDAAASRGVLFPRFYANGQKSMDGMSSLVSGYPSFPHIPYLGRGMEQSALSYYGTLARREGCETWFLQTEKRDSFRADAIAAIAGFDHFFGAEDIPSQGTGTGRATLRGAVWDHEMYAEAARRLGQSRKPFAAFLYTGSTHAPFAWPDPKWERSGGDSHDHRYRNSLAYADWALGRFLESARAGGWYDRTIFVLTSDHIAGGGGVDTNDPPTQHHIPCLVLAPGLEPRVDRRIGSQLDVIPTIVDLAGWGGPYANLGSSLFDETPSRGAVCVQGDLILRIEDGGWVLHDLRRRTAGRGSDLDAMERRLLAFVQVAVTLLRQNRLHRN